MAKIVAKKYKYAVIATDVVIFTIEDGKLKALLIKMKKHPFKNSWALPGGLIGGGESVESAAKRNLFDKTGVKDVYLEQLYTFGRVNRDPFGRVVSVAYFALITGSGLKLKTSKEYEDVKWYPVNKLPELAYDHSEIIGAAVKRLRSKLEYTNIVYGLLSNEFSLTDLQNTYEIILGRKLDKRNFRKKISSLNIIERINKKIIGEAHRPAYLYKFIKKSPQVVEIL